MTDPRFDPAFQRGYDGPNPEVASRGQVRASPVDPAPDAAAAPEIADLPEPLTPAPSNPYRLALLLFGLVLLIAAASTLYWQVLHPQATSTTVEAQFIEVLVSSLPQVLGLVGFVCVILWLALGALDRVSDDPDRGDD